MLSGRAFRAQLVTQGQRELFDYWLQSAGHRPMPARSDLDPLKVPRLLPHLGLIDLRDGVDQGLFRLAGTRLRDIYGQEITGKRIGEVFSGDCAAYWRRIHGRVARERVPAHGVVRGPAEGRDHVVLFWLRLPLSEDGGQVDRILCHDVAGPSGTDHLSAEFTLYPYSRSRPSARTQSRRVQFG
ncbi:MAG: PAS domain-containing protein [Methyloceanibacter sp.]|uniref:PAS domain-containing protein n=1 Tax=Methyloceanibacter sp. TaxID=1965321 RepID=UPI003D6D82B9